MTPLMALLKSEQAGLSGKLKRLVCSVVHRRTTVGRMPQKNATLHWLWGLMCVFWVKVSQPKCVLIPKRKGSS